MTLDQRVAELAARYRPLAVELLREAVRIPADQVDLAADDGGDPLAGLSNHERPRLEMLRDRIVEIGAVRAAADVGFDEFGNLVWTVDDPDDGIEASDRVVIYLDGHSDTVQALRDQWHDKLDGAIDPYHGLVDGARLDHAAVRSQLGYLPPDDEWEHLVFGRGAADQLAGVVSQIVATKILLELAPEGALRGAIVRSHATVAEEDNDGGGPRYLVREVLPGAPALIPDVVILTEGTGDSDKGALGIYRGQRGRMQIELAVTGRSCHGSMPHLGLNPLEHGGAIVAEAARRAVTEGFADHEFLGAGTRTASWSSLETPSDCAVPDRFTIRFDRRLTVGESPALALAEIERLDAVRAARDAGLTVELSVPTYDQPTHTGYVLGNEQIYPGWETPADHPAIVAAVESYRRVVAPHVVEPDGGAVAGARRREPRVDRWVFSTDGVGYPVPVGAPDLDVPASKRWVVSGDVQHPAMFGFGAGIEQNTHRIGEHVDERELEHAIALIARFPSLYAGT
jgi:putative selenium metabolism hydrolase